MFEISTNKYTRGQTMDNYTFIVEGGHRLNGEIIPSGNKNEALPVIAAALLTDEEVIIENIPDIQDTNIMLNLARILGAEVKMIDDHTYSFKAAKLISENLAHESAAKIRASLLFMGPLLARTGKVSLPVTGGDKIGRRRVDTHILAFEKMGAEVTFGSECVLNCSRLKGRYILLDEASVMATENAVMAAVLASGTTTIYNAACEPHVQGLCNMLNSMGGRIKGIGTNLLTIKGVEKLHGCRHLIMPDHIEIGSFIGLAAATRSRIVIKDAYSQHLDIILSAFERIGIIVKIKGKELHISDKQKLVVKDDFGGNIPVISDQPWPCFPADLTSIMVASALFARGTIVVHEKLFENRLFFTDALIQMGGKIVLCDPHRVVINGPSELRGVKLSSPDIRAGMAMLIAAMAAEGTSTINNVIQIDRGYEKIDERLNRIGAKITRIAAK